VVDPAADGAGPGQADDAHGPRDRRARAAQAQGLVEEVCEPGQALTTALALADEYRPGLATVRTGWSRPRAWPARRCRWKTCWRWIPTATGGARTGSEDFAEGRTAFMDKRRPGFTGR
jgi:enoyl-CoA hydratase/carnithine racemase